MPRAWPPRAAPEPARRDRDAALHARREGGAHAGFGAEVVLHGDTLEQARAHAFELAAAAKPDLRAPVRRRTITSWPAGTVGLEMLQVPDLDVLVIAIGGGGLIGGIATAARRSNRASRSWACRPRFPAMFNAIKGHHPQGTSTIAEGIAVGTPGQHHRGHHPRTGRRPASGGRGRHRAGGADAAGNRKPWWKAPAPRDWQRCSSTQTASRAAKWSLVLCGGNIEPLLLVRHHRTRGMAPGVSGAPQVSSRDVPGALARITAGGVPDAGANIDEVAFTSAPSVRFRHRMWRSNWCCRPWA